MKLINESPLLARFGEGFLEVVETRLSGELQELGLPSLEQIVVTEFEAEAYARTVHRYGDRLGFPKGQRAAEKRLPWGVCGPGN